MSSATTAGIESNSDLARSATVAGALIAVLGLLAIVFPFVTGLSLSLLLGAALVVGALVHTSHAFSAGSVRGGLWQVVLAVIYGVGGIVFMANPVLGLTTLTFLAIGFLLADGVVEVVWGIRSRGQPGALGLLVSGGISLLLGGLLWAGLPSTALWAVGLLLGVNLLATGLSLILLGRGTADPVAREVPRESQGGM